MEFLDKCPVCQSSQNPVFFLICNDYLTHTGSYNLVRCQECGLVFTNPRPSEAEMARFYKSEEYISHNDTKGTAFSKIYFLARLVMLRYKSQQIKKLNLKGRRLLDVGCGTGAFAAYMQKKGFTVSGVEPEKTAREIAQSKGIQVYDSINDPQLKTETGFDLITLWHVFEHQAFPIESLKHYSDLLVPGGHLVLAIPQYESFDAQFYQSRWAAYDLPRHLFHFSEKSLVMAATNRGFIFLSKSGLPFDAFYVSLLSEKYIKNLLGSARALSVALWSNLLGKFSFRPWSSQIFVFQKPSLNPVVSDG